jgi:hypothetical protein
LGELRIESSQRFSYLMVVDRSSQTAEHLTLASLGKSPAAARALPGAGASSSSPTGPALITQPTAAVTVDSGKASKGDRGKSQFAEDEDVPAAFRAQLKDCASVFGS